MKRLLAWIAGLAGGAAVVGYLRRDQPGGAVEPAAPDPRAEELRAKLAESQALVDVREEDEANELTVDAAEPGGDPDARRRAVHQQGREAADRMRGGSTD